MPAKIHISPGNTKMGKVPSVSFPPCTTCAPDAPCKKVCYARKAYRMYEATRKAYQRNLRIYRRSPVTFWNQLDEYLERKQPRFFRFHVSGDIPDANYLATLNAPASISRARDLVGAGSAKASQTRVSRANYLATLKRTAAKFPKTKFLVFTKRYQWVAECRVPKPVNLSIVLSAWPGYELWNPERLPVAWMIPRNGEEPRCPSGALECPGNCETCGACFGLDRDVAFHQH
jgi:hypothetical protein